MANIVATPNNCDFGDLLSSVKELSKTIETSVTKDNEMTLMAMQFFERTLVALYRLTLLEHHMPIDIEQAILDYRKTYMRVYSKCIDMLIDQMKSDVNKIEQGIICVLDNDDINYLEKVKKIAGRIKDIDAKPTSFGLLFKAYSTCYVLAHKIFKLGNSNLFLRLYGTLLVKYRDLCMYTIAEFKDSGKYKFVSYRLMGFKLERVEDTRLFKMFHKFIIYEINDSILKSPPGDASPLKTDYILPLSSEERNILESAGLLDNNGPQVQRFMNYANSNDSEFKSTTIKSMRFSNEALYIELQ